MTIDHKKIVKPLNSLPFENTAYRCGQAEARLKVVPGLMPSAYVLGLLEAREDAKAKKHPDKNRPGLDWVEDPSVKDGGYYRKSKNSSKSAAVGGAVVGAVLLGAGAAAVAAHRRNVGTKPSHAPILPIVPDTPSAKRAGINKKAAVGAGIGALALAGAGVTAINRRKPEATAFKGNAPTAGVTSAQLPPAKYQSRYPPEVDPWEAKVASGEATTPAKSSTPAESGLPQLPPAKPVIYKRRLVPTTPKLRNQINKLKREQTELEKARDKVELGQRLQQNVHSPVDMMRGVDVETAAQEKITNLKARSPERTPARLATIRGKVRNSVRGKETAEESRVRKKKEQDNREALEDLREQLPDNIPVTPTTKASKSVPPPLTPKAQLLETGELPSRGEIVKAVGQEAVAKAKDFGRMVKEKGVKRAVLQQAQNARERRQKIAKAALQAGVDLPQTIKNTKATAIEKVTSTAKKLTIEEVPPLAGSIVGGIVGGAAGGYPGYLAGDLAGTAIVRKAQLDIEATRKAQQRLTTSVNYRNATQIEKMKMLGVAAIAELETPEMQAKIARKRKEDLAGWAIGNATGKIGGYNPIVAGSLAAATTNSAVAAASQVTNAIKNRGVVGAVSYALKSAVTAPRKAIESVKKGNQREKEIRENIKRAILAAKVTRKTDSKTKRVVAAGIKAIANRHYLLNQSA